MDQTPQKRNADITGRWEQEAELEQHAPTPTLHSALFDKIGLWNRGRPVITLKNKNKIITRIKSVGRQGYLKFVADYIWHLFV